MSSKAWKEIVAVPRHTIRRMRTTIRGSPIKALAELIINSEDSYYRLEEAGLPASGLIQVGYWKRTERGHETVRAFSVRDYAEGIPFESLDEKFGRYGADTSGHSRRGYFGQGAKDALCMMRNGLVLTVHDGRASLCRFKTENEVPKYLICDEAEADAALKEFNERIKGEAPLDKAQNGTLVYFEMPLSQHAPKVKTIKESLETLYMLRKLLADPKRKVQLIDHDTGEAMELKPLPLEGELLHRERVKLHFASLPLDVELAVYRASRDLNQQPGERREGGLLVVDEHDAVLDLTLFGYDYESSAARLFGEVRIEGFKPLFRKDGLVITESREGLDYNHPFNRLLRQRIRESLARVLERLEKEALPGVARIDEALDRRFRAAFSRINSLIRNEADRSFGEGFFTAPPQIPEKGLAFSLPQLTVEFPQSRRVHLVVDVAKVPSGSLIELKADNPNLELEPQNAVEVPVSVSAEDPASVPILVSGREVGVEGTVTASFADLAAHLHVRVVEEKLILPPSGFGFVPDRVRIYAGERGRLRLLADTQVVSPGSEVTVKSDNPNVRISELESILRVPSPSSGSTSSLSVKVEGLKAGERAVIRATCQGREATAKVYVSERLTHGGLFRGYSLDFQRDPRRRWSFDRQSGIIYVHMAAPVLRGYFGENGERLVKEKRPEALALLAESLLSCICQQWAHYRFEAGLREYANPDDPAAMWEEEEAEATQIDYEFGRAFHDWIIGFQPHRSHAETPEVASGEAVNP
ncbi:MAG: hypothetical protein QW057_08490 [Candidatus Bathyarchaeia archaeon]